MGMFYIYLKWFIRNWKDLMERKRHESNRIILSKLIKILFIFLWIFGMFAMTSIKSDVLATTWSYWTLITGWFWSGNPSDQDIINKLYGDSSAYTREWDITSGCTNMTVNRVSTLPTSLSSNTIYVVSSAAQKITAAIMIPKCVAIVSSANSWTLITTSTQVNGWVFSTLPNVVENNVIIDNINLEWKYYDKTSHNLSAAWIEIYSMGSPTVGYGKNVTINNSTISNFTTWIYMHGVYDGQWVSYLVLSNIRLISNTYWIMSANASNVNMNNILWYWGTGITLSYSSNTSINNANFSVADTGTDIYMTEGQAFLPVVLNNVMWDVYSNIHYCYVNNLFGNMKSYDSNTKCKMYGYHYILNWWSTAWATYNTAPSSSPTSNLWWTKCLSSTSKGCATWDYVTSPVSDDGTWLYKWDSSLVSSGCFTSNKPTTNSYSKKSTYNFSFWDSVSTQIQPVKRVWSTLSDWTIDYKTWYFVWWNERRLSIIDDIPEWVTGTTVFSVNFIHEAFDQNWGSKFRALWPYITSTNGTSWISIWSNVSVTWSGSDWDKVLIVQLSGSDSSIFNQHYIAKVKKNTAPSETKRPTCTRWRPVNICISWWMAWTITLACEDNVWILTTRVAAANVLYDTSLFILWNSSTVSGTGANKTFTFTYTWQLSATSGTSWFTLKTGAVLDTSNNGNLPVWPSDAVEVDNLAPDVPHMIAEPIYTPWLSNTVECEGVRDNWCNWEVYYQFCLSGNVEDSGTPKSDMIDWWEANKAFGQLSNGEAEWIERTDEEPKGKPTFAQLWKNEWDIVARYDGNTKIIYIYTESETIKFPENSSYMFANMKNLSSIKLWKIDTSEVVSMVSMFENDAGIKELDLSQFDTSSVTDMTSMFANCGKLTTIYASDKFVNKAKWEWMFWGVNHWYDEIEHYIRRVMLMKNMQG